MERLSIVESDIEEQFIRSGGPGGQHVNKVSTCVRLVHRPSGMEVRCQRHRSRSANRDAAREELCDKLERHHAEGQQRANQSRFKNRFKNRRRSARQKRIMREGKRKRGQIKRLRRRPSRED